MEGYCHTQHAPLWLIWPDANLNCFNRSGTKHAENGREKPMDSAIGAALKSSTRLLWVTVLAAALIVGADMALVAFGPSIGLDELSPRFTFVLAGSLWCAFLSAAQPPLGGNTFGFRVTPRQGWLFWIRVTAIVGGGFLVIFFCAGLGFVLLGLSHPEPRLKNSSQIWPLFVWMCITVPLFEEVVYRLVFCPPFAALLGAR